MIVVAARRRTRRAPAATVVAAVLLLAAAAVMTAAVHRLVSGHWHPAVVAARAWVDALDADKVTILVVAAAVGLIGIVLVLVAILPGRRDGWRLAAAPTTAAQPDLAFSSRAVARRAARVASIRDGVIDAEAAARGRTVTVHVVTLAADRGAVRQDVTDAVAADLGRAGLEPPPRVRVLVRGRG